MRINMIRDLALPRIDISMGPFRPGVGLVFANDPRKRHPEKIKDTTLITEDTTQLGRPDHITSVHFGAIRNRGRGRDAVIVEERVYLNQSNKQRGSNAFLRSCETNKAGTHWVFWTRGGLFGPREPPGVPGTGELGFHGAGPGDVTLYVCTPP